MSPATAESLAPSERSNKEVVLEVRNVFKRFNDDVAVNDVSFKVYDGEFLFLIGPSGCGKTTTLRMIGGYLEPSEGEILIRGRPMNGVPLEKRNIGMVFQTYALFPHMTVAQNVGFGLRMRGVPKREREEKVKAALDLVELTPLANRYPIQLSGGQRQRVAIGRVIAYEPDILLLDEPLANLDRRLRDQMRIELKKLQEKIGITTVYVTHDQEEALSMADRVAVMENGELLQFGSPDDVYNSPSTAFVATFLGNTTSFGGVVKDVEGDHAHIEVADGPVITVSHAQDLKVGEDCLVSIRPERVLISESAPKSDVNVFEGVVELQSYLGAIVEYVIRLNETGAIIRASEPLPNGKPTFDEGSKVFVSWDPDQAIYLKS